MNNTNKQLFMLGCSHHTTPLEIRECFALDAEKKYNLCNVLKNEVSEFLVLNTCNRVELYGVDNPDSKEKLKDLYCSTTNICSKLFNKHHHALSNHEVVKHIFSVASGIDSQMVGEAEIFGQIKTAYTEATNLKTVGPVLNRVFQKAFQTGKWARTNTAIGEGQVSIGTVATELAARIFGDLRKVKILIIGSGEVGEKAIQALKGRGAETITVSNRSFEKAHKLAERFSGSAIPYEQFGDHLHQFDVIIASTSAQQVIINKRMISNALKKRPELPLFLIDLSVPRNIDPDVGSIANIYLYNLDDLAKVANENIKMRQVEIDKCREHVQWKAETVWESLHRFFEQ